MKLHVRWRLIAGSKKLYTMRALGPSLLLLKVLFRGGLCFMTTARFYFSISNTGVGGDSGYKAGGSDAKGGFGC